ncbi:VOC family protein, partial [Listeria innocua]
MALNAKSITVGLPVSDLEKSASWYEKILMSDEKLTPVEGVIEYQIGSVWIQ